MKQDFCDDDLIKKFNLCRLNHYFEEDHLRNRMLDIDYSPIHFREKYKKKAELLLLYSFTQHFPSLSYVKVANEKPDFIVKIEDKIVGIELSEVIDNTGLMRIESTTNKIFERLEKSLHQLNNPDYYAYYFIDFHDYHLIRPEHEEMLANEILKMITKRKKSKIIKRIRKLKNNCGVFMLTDYNLSLFDGLDAQKILTIIHKKNKKHPHYDTSVDECWLVMVSNMNKLSSRFSYIENKEALQNVQSPFDKIYHLDSLYGSLTAIK